MFSKTDVETVRVGRLRRDLMSIYNKVLVRLPNNDRLWHGEGGGGEHKIRIHFYTPHRQYVFTDTNRPQDEILMDACLHDRRLRLAKPVEFLWYIRMSFQRLPKNHLFLTTQLAVITSGEMFIRGQSFYGPILCTPADASLVWNIWLDTTVVMTEKTSCCS